MRLAETRIMKSFSLVQPRRSLLPVALLLATVGQLAAQVQDAGAEVEVTAEPIDFAHQVVPILQEHCVGCHGGREAKGSFSLNTRELLVDSGHVEIGVPDESYLLELVGSEDRELQMPPADQPRVSASDQQVLRRWIAEGASWDDGFSFAPQNLRAAAEATSSRIATGSRTDVITRLIGFWMRTCKQHGQPRPASD